MVLRMSPIMPALLGLCVVAGSVSAGSMDQRGYRHHNRESVDGHKHHHRRDHNAGVASPGGLPSVVPGIGTFSGAISAVRIKGVGNYFMVNGNLGGTDGPVMAPKARIIEIQGEDACSYEAGVCVIRP